MCDLQRMTLPAAMLALALAAPVYAQSTTPPTSTDDTATTPATDTPADTRSEREVSPDSATRGTTTTDDPGVTDDTTMADNRLPSTATPLWLLAMAGGGGLVLTGVGMRALRKGRLPR